MRVLHLTGSSLDAFHADLSHLYARDCLEVATGVDGLDHAVADVRPDGSWAFPADLSGEALAAAAPVPVGAAVAQLVELAPDVALPQLFDRAGMTHHRALLEVLGIPYVGNPPTVMALAADKARARAVVAAAGVAVPDGEVVARGGSCTLPPPVVVKPVAADNSVGVTLVRDDAGLHDALAAAWDLGGPALVERYVPAGREVRVGTIALDGDATALPVEEYPVDDADRPVRAAADKLARDDDGGLRLVAKGAEHAWIVDPDDPVVPAAQQLGVAAHRALGCRHYGLFDLRIDPDGQPWFLEAGPYWSFARGSVLTAMAAAAGHDLPDVLGAALRAAASGTDAGADAAGTSVTRAPTTSTTAR